MSRSFAWLSSSSLGFRLQDIQGTCCQVVSSRAMTSDLLKWMVNSTCRGLASYSMRSRPAPRCGLTHLTTRFDIRTSLASKCRTWLHGGNMFDSGVFRQLFAFFSVVATSCSRSPSLPWASCDVLIRSSCCVGSSVSFACSSQDSRLAVCGEQFMDGSMDMKWQLVLNPSLLRVDCTPIPHSPAWDDCLARFEKALRLLHHSFASSIHLIEECSNTWTPGVC